jgi:predicted ATPase
LTLFLGYSPAKIIKRVQAFSKNQGAQMRIQSVELKGFKRFHHLKISLPDDVKLVVLAGPNGCGKSSLFEAFNYWHRMNAGWNLGWDQKYYPKAGDSAHQGQGWSRQIEVRFHGALPTDQFRRRKLFYIRSAYRNDPHFENASLSRQGAAIDEIRFNRLIDNDVVVSRNYQRLASQALEDVFDKEPVTLTVGEFREKAIGDIRSSMRRVFPDLLLNDLGNPLLTGTFRFDKGTSRRFLYMNLSGGEKAAFDLLLDMVVKCREFDDTVYCIDEPEAHLSTRLQAALLNELVLILPGSSQLWLATHSIGMMRHARDMERERPGTVAFLDFSDLDFDQPQTLAPVRTTRAFWERVLNVALDDLSTLVAPAQVVICEGAPAGAQGKNAEHDAICYNSIFESEFPDTRFFSAGNSADVVSDRLALVAFMRGLAVGCKVVRLIDRDDHSDQDVVDLTKDGITVLGRRNLESYLYDDEVLSALCAKVGMAEREEGLLQDKKEALAQSVVRGNAPNDLKSAAGTIYSRAKQRLSLTGVGNDAMSFARNTLVPLVTPDTSVYKQLRSDIFRV